jgi:hypothetical protein
MDDRHAHLVAAAEALRTWVHAQRATWTNDGDTLFTNVPAPAWAPVVAVDAPIARFVIAEADIAAHLSISDVEHQGPSAPSLPSRAVDLAATLARILDRARTLIVRVAPVIQRAWRPLLAVGIVVTFIWTTSARWPSWVHAIQTPLVEAGRHAAMFARDISMTRGHPAVVNGQPAGTQAEMPGSRRGALQVDSNPSGAHVLIDGHDHGVTPVVLTDLSIGSHTVVVRSEQGSVQRVVSVAPGKTTKVNEAIYSGWLHVSSPIELRMSESARGIVLDDSNQVLLSPGPHSIRFENRPFGFVETRQVDVRPGETTLVSIVPPASKLSVTATTAADVLIDGVAVGGTPLVDYAVTVGTREVTVRNAGGAERRAMVTVTIAPVHLDVDFSRP